MLILNASSQDELIIEFGEATILSKNINSENIEIMPILSENNNTLYYVKDELKQTQDGYKTGQNIWTSSLINGNWSTSEKMTSHLNNNSNNAVIGISKDGQRLYLINAYEEENESHGISISHKKGNHWSKPEQIEIEGMTYKNDHYYGFYISPDENVLIISMEADNGAGKEDLYISLKKEGIWSTPKSLGKNVNSKGYEMSPFLSPDQNRIYFSSNGFGGLGDADIFYIEKQDGDWFKWSTPINLGENINSIYFDAYFSIGTNNNAYFSSSRNNNNLEIYSSQVNIIEPIIEEPIAEEKPSVETKPIIIEKDPQPELEKGEVFNEFYFAVNSSILDKEAKELLDNISNLLKEDAELKVELTSHADKRNDENYNLWLTNKRYERAKNYLITNGISENRIIGKGVGESQPKVNCDKCTEEIHRKNRVTEIRVY